ncbi:glycosyltransferase family A protein [Octadecabacter sp. 1_MG-2023]|uniref:glycosyltransferase n=1 Tax=unclassified Octadecabacter TaxID=196158 RepID=UPI001C084A7B|nr:MULTISPECIES: glycosyltransferase family A protein [unclassified Octadecabacter]MBU2994053.1 glycosyltransferase family 2 protein [Octadecabacter sp. B2R22]MDO6736093.1 glycosyltransferase family A protein [Octadecabacter sp. 1_MG-2023]
MDRAQSRSYVIISPCRNEAAFMRRTLDSVVAQTCPPALWVIVDDGSTDETPQILADYAAKHDWIRIVQKPDRGHRAVGPGVVDAFYVGLDAVPNRESFTYLCKLDLDLDLPPRYFEELISRMEDDPRIGTCSGKPYVMRHGQLVSERRGDEMSVGMTKFYRRRCFDAIGGFVRDVMWDAIDCHKARQLGWRAVSWDTPELRFEHLRPMGSSQVSIYEGRRRHGYGQYFMGSDPFYFTATAAFRALEPPYVLGGLAMMQGYFGAMVRGKPRLDDPELIAFIRAYQRRALTRGRAAAIADIDAKQRVAFPSPVGARS